MNLLITKKDEIAHINKTIHTTAIEPYEVNAYLQEQDSAPIVEKQKVAKLLLRPGVSLNNLINAIPHLSDALQSYSDEALLQSEIQTKYERYIEKEEQLVAKVSEMENFIIPDIFNYDSISALSHEALQKFKKIKPRTIGQASRISGVNPSDIQILMVYMGR